MVATFNNYQELVDRALMIEGKQQQIENRKRKHVQGKHNSGAQQKPRFTPRPGGHFQHIHGGGSSHNHNARRMVMGMEEETAKTVPTHQHQPRGI